jgi:hypothetical protein
MGLLDKLLGSSDRYHDIPSGDSVGAVIFEEEWRRAKKMAELFRPEINRILDELKAGMTPRSYHEVVRKKNEHWDVTIDGKQGRVYVQFYGIPRLDDALGELYGSRGFDLETHPLTETSTCLLTVITPAV